MGHGILTVDGLEVGMALIDFNPSTLYFNNAEAGKNWIEHIFCF
jgi:hypothetical protein